MFSIGQAAIRGGGMQGEKLTMKSPPQGDRHSPFTSYNRSCSIARGFPGGSEVKASACNAGDLGSIPGSGRSPGEGNGNPLQYSCLGNPMDREAWWPTVHGVAKSWTLLSDFTHSPTHSLTQQPELILNLLIKGISQNTCQKISYFRTFLLLVAFTFM